MDSLTITRPDDWHIHLRDKHFLATTVADVARHFERAIIMPNLQPPVTSCADALAYRERIVRQLSDSQSFTPLMTLYLTDNTLSDEIVLACESDYVYAVKYYPAGATTNSSSGVTDLTKCYAVLEIMEERGMPLLVHGEVTDPDIDIFDREQIFIERHLAPLSQRYPKLKIVMEHITTADAVQFVLAAAGNIAATLTPQHLLFNRNDMLVGGIRPHFYCLPILKRSSHQQALLDAATCGNPKFFLGTDSAPHIRQTKEASCGCAGCYTSPAALELYATAFENMNALQHLEGFASHHGPDFYGLSRNQGKITLIKKPWQVPEQVAVGNDLLTPLLNGQTLAWQVSNE